MKLAHDSSVAAGHWNVLVSGDVTGIRLSAVSEPVANMLGSSAYSGRLSLNLASAGAIDSSGVSWLIRLHQRFTQSGGKLVVHSISPAVAKVLRVLRLQQFLRLARTRNEADQLLAKES